MTRFVWLRQFEPGNNSADANRLLDRLEHLRRLAVPEGLFHDVPAHRITRLRRQGERYFADGLRELPDSRRLAILAVCAVEWELFLADAVVETHDRIVGRTYREAARTCEGQLGDETAAVREALRAFAELGTALIGARDTGEALNAVIADRPGWEGLGDLVARAAALANTVASDPLNHVLGGYSRFRRYTPRMLRTLDIEASPVAKPLLEAVDVLRSDATARPTVFLRPNSKWSRLLRDRRGVPVPGPRPDGVDRRTLAAGWRRGGSEAAGATSQPRLRCVLGLPRSARVPAEPRPAIRGWDSTAGQRAAPAALPTTPSTGQVALAVPLAEAPWAADEEEPHPDSMYSREQSA